MPMRGQIVDEDAEFLLRVYERARGKERVEAANHLFRFLHREEATDSLIRFDTHIRPVALDVQVYYWMGVYLQQITQYERALECYDLALKAARRQGDVNMESELLNEKAIAYFRLSDFVQAITMAKACLESCQGSDNKDLMCRVLNTISSIYVVTRQPAEALPYNARSIAMANELGDSFLLGIRYGIRCEIYHSMGEEEKAIESATVALRIDSLRGDTVAMAVRRVQMAAAVAAHGDSTAARAMIENALPALREAHRRPSIVIALIQLGELLLGEGRDERAVACLTEALQLSEASGNRYHQARIHHALYRALHHRDSEQALRHLDAYAALKDSLYNDDTKAILAGFEAQLRNTEITEEKTRIMTNVRYGLITAIVLLSVLLVALAVLTYAYRQQRRTTLFLQYQTDRREAIKAFSGEKMDDELDVEDRRLLNQLNKTIYRLMGKGTIDLETLASQMALSPSSLRRKLFMMTGYTPANYVLRLRLDRACQLLRSDVNVPIGEIATRCGFDNSANFSRAFRQIYNQSPSDYRRSLLPSADEAQS